MIEKYSILINVSWLREQPKYFSIDKNPIECTTIIAKNNKVYLAKILVEYVAQLALSK